MLREPWRNRSELFRVAKPPLRDVGPRTHRVWRGPEEERAEFFLKPQEPDRLLKLLGNESVQSEKVVIYYHY